MGSASTANAAPGFYLLSSLQKHRHRHANILGDLSEQDRGNIPAAMNRHGRASAIWMAKLLVGAPLPNFFKTQCFKSCGNFTGLEDRELRHSQATSTF